MRRSVISRAEFLSLTGAGFIASGYLLSSTGRVAHARTPLEGSGEFPVGIWWPPPPGETTTERYREIRDAGFNFVIAGNGIDGESSTLAVLDAAHANSLRLIVSDDRLYRSIRAEEHATAQRSTTSEVGGETFSSPLGYLSGQETLDDSYAAEFERSTVSLPETQKQDIEDRVRRIVGSYGEHPAFEGLKIYDEPHAALFGGIRYAQSAFERAAPGKSPYVVIGPTHSSPQMLGTSSYSEYLQRYTNRVSPPFLSFDHYPLLSGKETTRDYFLNWAQIRSHSLQHGVPAWGFIQSVDFDGAVVGLSPRRRPSRTELLWQTNVALVYGAKGLQYFTYWTPEPRTVDFGQALISREGTRTQLYSDAKSVNSYLGRIGRMLLPLVSESVQHAGERPLPTGTASFRGDYFVNSVSGSPVILGRFRKPGAGERYLLVVNRSFSAKAGTTLRLGNRVYAAQSFDTTSQTFQKLRLSKPGKTPQPFTLNLQPGAARLLRLYRR